MKLCSQLPGTLETVRGRGVVGQEPILSRFESQLNYLILFSISPPGFKHQTFLTTLVSGNSQPSSTLHMSPSKLPLAICGRFLKVANPNISHFFTGVLSVSRGRMVMHSTVASHRFHLVPHDLRIVHVSFNWPAPHIHPTPCHLKSIPRVEAGGGK